MHNYFLFAFGLHIKTEAPQQNLPVCTLQKRLWEIQKVWGRIFQYVVARYKLKHHLLDGSLQNEDVGLSAASKNSPSESVSLCITLTTPFGNTVQSSRLHLISKCKRTCVTKHNHRSSLCNSHNLASIYPEFFVLVNNNGIVRTIWFVVWVRFSFSQLDISIELVRHLGF